jgi:hypothetical protein
MHGLGDSTICSTGSIGFAGLTTANVANLYRKPLAEYMAEVLKQEATKTNITYSVLNNETWIFVGLRMLRSNFKNGWAEPCLRLSDGNAVTTFL